MRSNTSRSAWRLTALGIAGAFITYFSMYAFRKPFTAGVYEGLSYFGVDYKILLVLTQVAGYALSKFLGIKVISELLPARRTRYLLGLIGISWVALFFFGITPYPYNFVFLFFNGLPLGMIWGIVFAFLEGRRQTELLAAGLASSFIVASGFVKSIGRGMVLQGVSEFWMPFLTGAIFIPTLFLGVWLLSRMPPPDEADEAMRTRRVPMSKGERRRFFAAFAPGIILIVLIYMGLNGYRDFRDNFAVEIWDALGYAEMPSVLTYAEIPIAISVLVLFGLMIYVRNNRTAFYLNLLIIGLGGMMVLLTTYLFVHASLNPAVWMIAVGFGMYAAYISYHTMLFERWIAMFRYRSNIGYLMYTADAFGYLASVGILLYKDFWVSEMSWLNFFVNISFVMGGIAVGLSLLSVIYFRRREKTWTGRELNPVLQ